MSELFLTLYLMPIYLWWASVAYTWLKYGNPFKDGSDRGLICGIYSVASLIPVLNWYVVFLMIRVVFGEDE